MGASVPAIAAGSPVFLCSGQGSQKPGMGAGLMDVPEVARGVRLRIRRAGLRRGRPRAARRARRAQRHAQRAAGALRAVGGRRPRAHGARRGAGGGAGLLARPGKRARRVGHARRRGHVRAREGALGAHGRGRCGASRRDERAAEGRRGGRAGALRRVRRRRRARAGELQLPGADRRGGRARGRRARRGGVGRGRQALVAPGHVGRVPQPAHGRRRPKGMAAYLENVEFSEPRIPLICNVDAAPLSAADAREHLVRHLTSPVRFQQSVEALAAPAPTRSSRRASAACSRTS